MSTSRLVRAYTLHIIGSNTVIFAVLKAWLMSPLHRVVKWDFCTLISTKIGLHKKLKFEIHIWLHKHMNVSFRSLMPKYRCYIFLTAAMSLLKLHLVKINLVFLMMLKIESAMTAWLRCFVWIKTWRFSVMHIRYVSWNMQYWAKYYCTHDRLTQCCKDLW